MHVTQEVVELYDGMHNMYLTPAMAIFSLTQEIARAGNQLDEMTREIALEVTSYCIIVST